jgi:hypothetical protein
MTLRAPFPWFGGKSRAAHLVWARFGNVRNYVEPFAGSLAVLLARPTPPQIETVNDLDCYIANFWRAVQAEPSTVAEWADWPVNEADLHARHTWLISRADFIERMKSDPDFYDVKIAGWWVNGICQWIGGDFCAPPRWSSGKIERRRPRLGSANSGACGPNPAPTHKRPKLGGHGIGCGVHRGQIPAISGDGGATGRGVHASGRRDLIIQWFEGLRDRLRFVRVCSGDWSRVLGPSPTTHIGVTGILLDPPYGTAAGRDAALYPQDSLTVAEDVRAWAIAHGDDPKLRIALCGYEGEHEMPASWECVSWKASGGYGSQRKDKSNLNAARERIWFSPHCYRPTLPLLEHDAEVATC